MCRPLIFTLPCSLSSSLLSVLQHHRAVALVIKMALLCEHAGVLLLLWLPILAGFPLARGDFDIFSPIDHSAVDLGNQDVIDGGDSDIPTRTIIMSDKLQQGAIPQDGLDEADFWQPLQLMKPGEGHDRLELNVMTLGKLAAITDPVSLVAAVGPYHGGKSFMLNVLLNSTHGFDVGAVAEPETRGLWMRLVPKEKVTGVDGSLVVLLDTEGFYGEGATRSYDARVFALATLLSSHLVYNTLRTLGDAQSVTALADLAKQAQVFNLQNWLHTGSSNNDRSSSPLDVDVTMLLKTLHFPPLTWVVQGFDIGLQLTPMDHLQRYLAAHAHTGDRTLDTLFTQGIKCHTMRTPTDLNLLRQVVGDEGLAAKEELYPYLHPGYVADVRALQKTIFGNLRAKGKLTGKDLAGLLPILVHYVNEDFPLNADRKLRDVLLDVVVDGAFSGGIQYFQLCMQTLPDKEEVLASRRGKEVNVANAKLESAEGGTRLSSLAASAFTTDELEKLLSSAETRAIEYCKQRCVGVPLSKSGLACDGQLGIKIQRMKPRYVDENDHRVRDVLVLLGQGFRAAAEKEVDGLSLPMCESDIHLRCSQTIKDALQRYKALVGPHRDGHLYKEARVEMQRDIETKCDKVYRINADKISTILGRGKSAYRIAYEEAITKEGCGLSSQEGQYQAGSHGVQKPCSTRRLTEIDKASQVAAQAGFDKTVKEEGLPWLGSGDEQYDFQNYQCAQWSRQRFREFQAQNDARLQIYCEHQAANLTQQYKEQIGKIVPFPDNDEVLTSKVFFLSFPVTLHRNNMLQLPVVERLQTDQLEKQFTDEYTALVKDFLPSPVAEDRKKKMVCSIEELKAHHLRKNTALMRAFCYDPLHDAYRELHMQDCERTLDSMWRTKAFWSRKCLWPGPKYTFGFKYAAYVAARKHLEIAQSASKFSSPESANGIVLSVATRNKVIESWIDQDLGAHAHVVFVNFIMLAMSVVVIVGSFACGGLQLRSRNESVPPRRPLKNDLWPPHEPQVRKEVRRGGYFGAQYKQRR